LKCINSPLDAPYDIMPSTVPDTLREAREAKAWSQRQLGQRAGMPQAHISRIESGAIDPKLSTLQDLARVLDLELVLAPRAALAAVDVVVRESAQDAERLRLREIVSAMHKAAHTLQAMAGGLDDRVADAADGLSRLDLSALSPVMRHEVLAAAAVVDEAVAAHNAPRLETAIVSLNRVLADARKLATRDAARPAYSLDEEP
jgi:predicted transcriptional regulator